MTFLFIFIPSCNKNPAEEDPSDDIGDISSEDDEQDYEIDYSICENCIWMQNDCNGNWIVGYSFDNSIAGTIAPSKFPR